MTLFSRALAWFGKGATSNNDTGAQYGSSGSVSTDAGISVNDERAMQVSSVWACVQYITNSVASLPINFYEKTKDGRKELERHHLKDLFHVSPNALMKPRDFRKAMTLQLCLWSNAYAEIFWNGDRPIAIVPLRPGRMTPYLNNGELTYHYQMDQGVRIMSRKSVLHLKGFGSDGIVGFERNNYARKTLGISVSADVYASKQFANGGNTGSGHISFDEFLTKEQREQARKLYEGFHETAYNKGKARILEGGAKWNSEGLNPDTMQMIETRKMQIGEIARFYGVPEILIGGGSSTSAWPASFEQQLLSFLTFTLQDYLDEWESAIKESLIPIKDRDKIFADHDVSGFIKMDSVAKAELQSKWVQNGLKTRNEIRKINNDPPKEGGDDLTVQVNLTPVQELEKVNKESEPVEKQSNELHEIKQRLLMMETSERIVKKIQTPDNYLKIELPEAQKIDVKVPVNIPKQMPPVVNIQNDINVPEQPAPIVNVKSPDVQVINDVKTPEVNVENKIEIPKKDKKIDFTLDKSGNVTEATLKDD